eukprot:c25896_g1_i1 orf=320-1897(-)
MGRIQWFILGVLSVELWASQMLFVSSSVHDYVKGSFEDQSNAYVFFGGSEGLHASFTGDNGTAGAYGSSLIRFESITFRRTEASAAEQQEMSSRSGLIQAIIFEVSDRDKIGTSYDGGQVVLCCTRELFQVEGCNLNEVIKRPSNDNPGWPKSIDIHFRGKEVDAFMTADPIIIEKTGMYSLYFIFCDPQLANTVINGKTIWKNPTGYLPGRMAPLMKFYAVMSLAFLVLGLVWLFQYIRFWKDILQLQNYITLVISLGMCEMVMWYFEYANFNATGYRPVGITLWAVTFGAVKKTVSRLLLLVVSMGYGVVKPTLGGLTSRVLLLGGTYFVAAESLDVVENVGAINDMSGKAKLFLALPVAILDAFFILWIFTSLSKTLEKLHARKSFVKLELYRKFTNSLAVAVVTSVAWIGYELYFKATDPFNEHWQNAWIVTAFWNILTFVLMCIICALWSPSHNAMRYAYSEEAREEFDDEEAIALTGTGTKSSTLEVDAGSSMSEMKDMKPGNTDVFRLDDDPEEDKRE